MAQVTTSKSINPSQFAHEHGNNKPVRFVGPDEEGNTVVSSDEFTERELSSLVEAYTYDENWTPPTAPEPDPATLIATLKTQDVYSETDLQRIARLFVESQ